MAVIELKNVSIAYGVTEVVSDISLQIEKGDFIGLTGPNGSGKSTLIKAILGLIPVSQGKITLLGETREKFSQFEKIDYLPQSDASINPLFPASVEEIIATGLLSNKKFPKVITKKDKEKIDQILDQLSLKRLRKKQITKLSGGQKQKVFLARSLVSQPEIIFLDEPSSALDQKSRKDFFQLLKKLNKERQMTIILITHDTGFAGNYVNKILYLDRKLIFFGKINEFCPHKESELNFEKRGHHLIWHQHE